MDGGGARRLRGALFEFVRDLDPAFGAWDEAGPYVAGAVIVAAAAYQLTPAEEAVPGRLPLPGYGRWPIPGDDERRSGALELGIRYGGWCLGCCWALMAALFAVGVMSVGWMVLIAAFIAAERLLPWPTGARRAVAAALLVLGLGIAFFPADVPGFAEPGGGMHGGGGMQGGGGGGGSMQMMP